MVVNHYNVLIELLSRKKMKDKDKKKFSIQKKVVKKWLDDKELIILSFRSIVCFSYII